MTKLIVSNEHMNDIMKIAKSLYGVLMKQKNEKVYFLESS